MFLDQNLTGAVQWDGVPDDFQARHRGGAELGQKDMLLDFCRLVYQSLAQPVWSIGFENTLNDLSTQVPAKHQDESASPSIEILAEGYLKQHGRLANLLSKAPMITRDHRAHGGYLGSLYLAKQPPQEPYLPGS